MRIPRFLRIGLTLLGAVLLSLGLIVGAVWLYLHPRLQRTNGLVYGQRNRRDLCFDILRPGQTNGFGVVLIVSGGWKSSPPGTFPSWLAAPLLRRGYTVFAVYHLSQPQATVMEIVADVNRAVRHIRHHASLYHISPRQLGAVGGSAGGHLSLMLATRGGPGSTNAADSIERESSQIQAAAVFYPPTDLLNLGDSTENLGDGGPPKSFVKAFGPQSTNLAVWKVTGHEMSPIYHVQSNLPPILIYHGDLDRLVPLDQSQRFQAEARRQGRTVDLVVHRGGKHGWLTMVWDIRQFADWFDIHLRGRTPGH